MPENARKIMPVGSMPPEEKITPGEETPGQAPIEKSEGSAPTEEPKLYAGKYKTPEEIEAAYTGLEKKLGEQGSRLGQAEKDKDFLMSQIEQTKASTGGKAPEEVASLNDQLEEIQSKVEEGDLTINEGLMQSVRLSSKIASDTAIKSVQQQQQQQAVESSQRSFLSEHPDFYEMQQAGVLDQAKSQLPGLHDDFSAYWAVKAQQDEQTMQTAVAAAKEEGIAAGKAEMQKIASGDTRTGKVLQKPGGQAKEIGRRNSPYTENQMKESGLAALLKARGG